MKMMIRACVVVSLLAAPVLGGEQTWTRFVELAAERHGDPGRRAALFLAEHRPERDEGIGLEVLLENLEYAMRAREEFPWCRELPETVFHNDVLPYAVLDETRESWRGDFYERGRRIVEGASSATEAAQALNRELFNDINVHYNTGRKRPNQSPSESIEQGRATCTGLSIILVDACRAVGVPARAAGVAEWYGKSGNHTWVEVWDGQWAFTGADEYSADGLNRAWFTGDASRAVAGSQRHAVWASSWQGTGRHFPMAWAMGDTSVPGVDVTHRYARRRAEAGEGAVRHLRMWSHAGGERLRADVRVLDPEGVVVASVQTRDGRADLNDMPSVTLVPGVHYVLTVEHGGAVRSHSIAASDAGESTLDLSWDELGLARDEAEALLLERWSERAEAIAEERREELEGMAFVHGDHTLKILEKEYGEASEGSRSLWISMHGGGGAPAEVNDQQWQNQIRLYEPEEGIYVAPRAPTNTWNLWHQGHIDPLFARMIETYVAVRGVDPDRVYLMGYSAGGDGVYQLAPRMADRFAAAAMMAGHPNEASPVGLRNLSFAIFMGGKDEAYRRNAVAEEWGERLEALRRGDAAGYDYRVTIYPEMGHWMQRKDAEALPWMASKQRVAWPERVVWRQDDVTHTRFYWLSVADSAARAGAVVTAAVEGQVITIASDDVTGVTLWLRDELVDLDRPITVVANGSTVFEGVVRRSAEAIDASLSDRADPRSAATARLVVDW